MTPEQWARLAPTQQWQHMARFGPPPPGWPVPAPSMPYLVRPAPAVNVTIGQSVTVLAGHRRIRHGPHLLMTILTGGLWGLLVWLPIVIFKR
jgi:hypothetical protein